MEKYIKQILKSVLKYFNIQISINKNFKEIPIPLTVPKVEQICFFRDIIKKTKDLEGDIVECGVGHGRSLLILTTLNNAFEKKKLYAFDSFEGFPDPKEYEKKLISGIKKGYYKSSLESVKIFLASSGIDNEDIKEINFVKGYLEDTLINYKNNISLLHIDVDLAESYKTVLNTLWDNIVVGGIIIFDEYNTKKWVTATQAINEFVKRKNLTINEYKTKNFIKHFVIKT